jgi:predicted house-cleaning noncanonical NTP pyrophosphatase (MazG superfamily)
MERFTKLVRDKIPGIMDQQGKNYEIHTASSEEYKAALIAKLGEETAEFAEAGAIEELADVLEVIESLRALPEYAEVEQVRMKKSDERGGFKERIILQGEK